MGLISAILFSRHCHCAIIFCFRATATCTTYSVRASGAVALKVEQVPTAQHWKRDRLTRIGRGFSKSQLNVFNFVFKWNSPQIGFIHVIIIPLSFHSAGSFDPCHHYPSTVSFQSAGSLDPCHHYPIIITFCWIVWSMSSLSHYHSNLLDRLIHVIIIPLSFQSAGLFDPCHHYPIIIPICWIACFIDTVLLIRSSHPEEVLLGLFFIRKIRHI